MLTRAIVDAIGDEFQSTFACSSPTRLSNCFAPEEVEVVEAIIKKHVPSARTIEFIKGHEIAPNYYVWRIILEA